MPITPFLGDRVFDPEAIRAMGLALVKACQALEIVDQTGRVTEQLAAKIIEAAARGERDPNKLCEAALHGGITLFTPRRDWVSKDRRDHR